MNDLTEVVQMLRRQARLLVFLLFLTLAELLLSFLVGIYQRQQILSNQHLLLQNSAVILANEARLDSLLEESR